MKKSQRKDEYLRQYVLGNHDSESQEQFEERLLTDEDLLAELSIVEDDVVRDYLSGTLSESEREKFENEFLATDAGKQELQFFGAFNNYLANLPAAENACRCGARGNVSCRRSCVVRVLYLESHLQQP